MVDIQNKEDINKLVLNFYTKAMNDPIIGFFFMQVSPIDLDEHALKITEFWNAILFGYDPLVDSHQAKVIKNMLHTHQQTDEKARMQKGHFIRWLYLFFKSVDELYAGQNAEKIKSRAEKMADSMSEVLLKRRSSEE